MLSLHPISTLTHTLFPYPTLFRSGCLMIVSAVFPSFGSLGQVRSELVAFGGVDPLVDFTTHADQQLRQMAAKALAQLSVNERARREIEKSSGMEPLLADVNLLRFKVVPKDGLDVRVYAAPDSTVCGRIPHGTIISVSRRELAD